MKAGTYCWLSDEEGRREEDTERKVSERWKKVNRVKEGKRKRKQKEERRKVDSIERRK